jgi:regulator of protease activity HflC (stomatin/prohibitin superfamily)
MKAALPGLLKIRPLLIPSMNCSTNSLKTAILRAEAAKEAAIRKAEGEAQAILEVQKAIAEGVRMLNEANPSQAVLALRGLEALKDVADGKATKIIIPSEIQGLAGLATALTEIVKKE